MMEPPKISFGFSKLTKKPNIISSKTQEVPKVQLIECLEGQSIKIKDALEEVKEPLIIPLKDNQKNLLDRIREFKKREQTKDTNEDTRSDSELTPDELVARQLLKEAQLRLANGSVSDNTKVSVLPINKDTPTLEGEKEPTLEDYESVPISDYGLALLRGMGWKEGMAIGKNVSQTASVIVPELRPKGLGLGATKVVQAEMPSKKATDKDGNELILKKGAFARVIAGNQKGNYSEVQGFDEEAGRVIIKVYPKGEIVNINELMVVPVTKEEFLKGYKIINNAKYDEYKEKSDKTLNEHRVKTDSFHSRVKKEESSWKSDSDGSDHGDHRSIKIEKHSHRKCDERPSTSSGKYRERSDSSSRSKERRKHKKDKRRRSRSNEKSSSKKHKRKSKRQSSTSSSDDRSQERRYRRRSKYN